MLVLYGFGRIPAPVVGWPRTYVPAPRVGSGDTPGSVSINDTKSLQPSPGCSWLPRQDTFAGPPVSRFDTPWVYSWKMTPLSKSPSRFGVVRLNTYICIRGGLPSAGVPK